MTRSKTAHVGYSSAPVAVWDVAELSFTAAGVEVATLAVLDAALSFAGADTITVRVDVAVRPEGAVTT